MIDVVVNKSRGESGDSAVLTFSGGPGVAGRLHSMVIYVAALADPGNWLEVTPFDLNPAGGETPDQAAAAFDGFINAYPRYESTTAGGNMQVEPKSADNYIEVAYLIDGEYVPGSYNPGEPGAVAIDESARSVFVDDAAVAARTAEVPDAEWNSGMLGGGGAGPGIGISTKNPGLDESLPNWTLLDQFGDARDAQVGQNIGGEGYTDPADYPSSGGQEGKLPEATIRLQTEAQLPTNAEKASGAKLDGELELPADGASLVDLDVGWAAQVAP